MKRLAVINKQGEQNRIWYQRGFDEAKKKIEDDMMNGDMREILEQCFPKDDDTSEHPSKSNRSAAILLWGELLNKIRKI